jgi:hypothetical protein
MEAPIHHNQGTDPKLAFAGVHVVEGLEAEILSEKMASAARIKAIKGRREDAYEEYRDKGIPKAFLKGAIKLRKKLAEVDDIKSELAEAGPEQGDLFDGFFAAVERGEADFKAGE